MTNPPSTQTALLLARQCIGVESSGPWHTVVYRPPGHSDSVAWCTLPRGNGSEAIERAIDNVAALLAPLVELGLRHREAMPKEPA